jgi:hypothetical protein
VTAYAAIICFERAEPVFTAPLPATNGVRQGRWWDNIVAVARWPPPEWLCLCAVLVVTLFFY